MMRQKEAQISFTDEELKAHKDKIDQPGWERHTKQFKALLNRLEAAEVVCALKEMHVCSICAGSLKLWSKSKGEG